MSGQGCTQINYSKLPVLEKIKLEDALYKPTLEKFSQMVGIEVLYGVLSEEHLGQQLRLIDATRKLKAEEAKRRELEACLKRENPINLALAERIQALEESEAKLKRCNEDLREENDLLEFRLLEMEDTCATNKRNVSRASESKTEVDDVSDSGVTSLPTSDDEHHEFEVKDRDVKTRLMKMCQNVTNVAERICLQQALALLRHYEARIEGLESTIAAMCNEAAMSRSMLNTPRTEASEPETKSSGRIIATVLPFSESANSAKSIPVDELKKVLRRENSELTESGIFEESVGTDRSTQTDGKESGGDSLSVELEKLTKIRQRIEWKGNLTQPKKDLGYYERRIEDLEQRLSVFDSSGDKQIRSVKLVVDRNVYLTAQIRHLNEKIERLLKDNRRLECERSELEEIENDTRLTNQRLEETLALVTEKKDRLKFELQQLEIEMAERQVEREKNHTAKMEALMNTYERKNQELEEKELEMRYRVQMLENTMPALMMWNIWRMMVTTQSGQQPVTGNPNAIKVGTAIKDAPGSTSDFDSVVTSSTREEELVNKLKMLENKLNTQNRLLEDFKASEEESKKKLRELEALMAKDHVLGQVVDQDSDQDVELFEKLGRMAKERIEMDQRIKDLELKEKLYKETIEHADSFIAQLENKFDAQLKEKDNLVNDQAARLQENEAKLRAAERESVSSGILEEKVVNLDNELKRLRNDLVIKDKEKAILQDAEKKLLHELQDAMNQIENMRGEIDGPLKAKIEQSKKRSQALEEDLKASEDHRRKMEADHMKEVASLKNEMMQMNRDLLENDVTISELKEEVQTLELAVDELRYLLNAERNKKEEALKDLEMKLEDKEMEVESMLKARGEGMTRCLRDELQERLAHCSDIADPELISSKGEFRFTTKENDHSDDTEDSIILSQIISEQDLPDDKNKEDLVSVYSKWKNLVPIGFTDITATQFQAFIAMIEQDEPQDVELPKFSLPREYPISKPGLSRECYLAQNAVANVNGKDVKGTVENLSKAYQHSKNCGSCNHKIGDFIKDIVKQLGADIPRSRKENRKNNEYQGKSSSLTKKDRGPKKVGWADEVQDPSDKCRLEISEAQLYDDEVYEKINCKQSKLEDYTSQYSYSQTIPEKEETNYVKKKNHVGLKVVRQVGPESLLIKWDQPTNEVFGIELYVNKKKIQTVISPCQTRLLLHSIDLKRRVTIRLNLLNYSGDILESAQVSFP